MSIYMQDPMEDRWRAESDARALARAREVEKDAIRLANAKAIANEMANEQVDEIRNIAGIAGMQVSLHNTVGYKYTNPAKIRNL